MENLTNDVVKWVKNFFCDHGQTKAVVGISGGKDSAVVAAICVSALGRGNVYGVLMPCGEQKDISDSYAVVKHLNIDYIVANIGDAFNDISALIPQFNISYNAKTNLPSRLRMCTLYAYAQSIGAMVANTCNLSEDIVGYSTLYGDSAGSFAPLSRLTTEEVIQIGIDLKLPDFIVHKTPVDGLQPKTDEEKLGFTYHELNELIRKNKKGRNYERIMELYHANKFKTEIIRIPCYDPCLTNYFEKMFK